MREAKEEANEADILKQLLDGVSFEDIPSCVCPIPHFSFSMTTIFCATKCYQPCDNFTEFTFIIDRCNNDGCYHGAPCSECIVKISDFKILTKGIKAIFNRRFWPARVKKRCKDFAAKNNKTWKFLKDKREKRGK